MTISVTRRGLIFGACMVGVAWAATAQAEPLSFKVALTGAQEAPAVETGGTGTADLTYDPATRTVTWSVSYSGLSGPATMGHFHGPAAAGDKAPVAIWLTKQGSAVETPVTGQATLTPDQAQQFAAGQWYINIHSQAH